MHASAFIAYLCSSEIVGAPARVIAEVRQEAKRRIVERFQSGRADSELTFDDLYRRCEEAKFRA